jgi:hypothetical protein
MIDTREVAQRWQEMISEIITGMAEWRQQHPKATLREIGAALDERLERFRAKMLEEAALLGQAREWDACSGPVFCYSPTPGASPGGYSPTQLACYRHLRLLLEA